jgi:hypothetical protein
MRELESPPDPNNPSIGGIGFVPTTEQIRQFYSASSAFESLQDEFDNNPESFFVNFFRPVQTDSGPQFRPGVPQIASFFLRGLEQFDPSGSLASTAVQPILDRPYVYFPVISQMVGEPSSLPGPTRMNLALTRNPGSSMQPRSFNPASMPDQAVPPRHLPPPPPRPQVSPTL